MLNVFEFLWQTVEKHSKRNWEPIKIGFFLHTSKLVCLLPVCLRNNRYLAGHISEPYAKFFLKIVKNCVRNRSRLDEIDTETEICTSLKSEFYFRFCWPPSTKSTLISCISFLVFVTIRGTICPPQSRNCQNRICTSLKSVIYFRYVSETIAFETTKFPSGKQNLVKIGKELRT